MVDIGLLNICKLPGMSSHDVVAAVRRAVGIKRVGHAGTLDPAACGVLPVCIGRATRLADYISAGEKAYRAEFLLGVSTDSHDQQGQVIRTAHAGHLAENDILQATRRFVGTIQQRPPAHSAIQVGGQRAYHLARRGEALELPAREVTIFAFSLVRFLAGEHPRLLADIICSKGTYIRSLARDIGEILGVGATLTFLARTRVAGLALEGAVTLDELAAASDIGDLERLVQSPDTALEHIPQASLPRGGDAYIHGTAVPFPATNGIYRVYYGDRFLGLGRVEEGELRPVVNLQ